MLRSNLKIVGVSLLLLAQIIDNAAAFNCLVCDSSTDANCINDLSKIEPKACTAETKCFTQKDSATGHIKRGCLADADATTCNTATCLQCTIDNCNKHKICKACDSANDPDCAQIPNNKALDNQICPAETTKCIINIKSDKQTERGCASAEQETQCAKDTTTCKLCEQPNCNTEVFPARPTCYNCSGNGCNEASDTTPAKVCQLYEAGLKCYTIGTSATDMERGCTSDANAKCKTGTETNCLTCEGDKCNNRSYNRVQKIKCQKCDSKETKTCEDEQTTAASALTDCKNQLTYLQEEMCRTQTKDNVTHRGCFYDLSDLGDCTEANACKSCTSDGCNKEAINKDPAVFTCIQCRSDQKPECWGKQADTVQGGKCRNGDGKELGCFHHVENGRAIRGCTIDADEQTRNACMDANNKVCEQCKEADCNKKTSGAGNLQLMSSLMLITIAVIGITSKNF